MNGFVQYTPLNMPVRDYSYVDAKRPLDAHYEGQLMSTE
jgi:hypothetical protein